MPLFGENVQNTKVCLGSTLLSVLHHRVTELQPQGCGIKLLLHPAPQLSVDK